MTIITFERLTLTDRQISGGRGIGKNVFHLRSFDRPYNWEKIVAKNRSKILVTIFICINGCTLCYIKLKNYKELYSILQNMIEFDNMELLISYEEILPKGIAYWS